ncbi:adenosylcobinamide kinase /adenosylcobinamide-phosphate guanylyltransferase [Natranaerovirga hydrolytica]|uniref:Adenosylcobinamide kinase n=1 Tax=Natranaerovirga hydrolytica TaxID=680378 RepID=A0A4R1MZ77_9FIRM|nr:bifunctional adenosylcobinamide kinase/adenosylcobinamide-phosphate guanylyltransferase [Natranaerovirga hydrolytica]TCK98627.1 adenosylcobinamide kinase /adenosylcobinamide-phosphate guanylyltransferase [Natranaerovirga hydrolytica]
MGKVIMVTGGARSGKSTFAEKKTNGIGQSISYIATAKAIDKDMSDRIEKHKASRPKGWHTFEMYQGFDHLLKDPHFINSDTFLLDCITIMITNIMFDQDLDYDTCSLEAIEKVEADIIKVINGLIGLMKEQEKNLIVVTNEVGYGLVPAYRLGNIFRDIAGRVNQYLAELSDEVYLVVSGIPVKIK